MTMWLQSIKQCEGAIGKKVATCECCKTPMPDKHHAQRFCSPVCQHKNRQERRRNMEREQRAPSHC